MCYYYLNFKYSYTILYTDFLTQSDEAIVKIVRQNEKK